MFEFQHISYLYALGLLPLLVVLFIAVVMWRKKKIRKLGDEKVVSEQLRGYIPGRAALKFILLSVGLFSIIMGLANLRTGDKSEKVQRKGVDVVIALDVSKSMLAQDVQPDRLTRAKQLIMRMTDKMRNDRVALIVFAGKSYLQVPLTVDYSAVKMVLQGVSPDMVPTQGTVIGDAIDMAMKSFSQNERKYKSLIIISDGEDHDETAIEKTKEAAENGVIVHTVGIGSPQGATLYDPQTKAVKLDENGNPVVSKLNEDEMRAIATAGHGTYSLLQNTDAVADKLTTELEGMEQKSLGSVIFTDFTSYYQYFLFAGFLLLLIEWLLPGTSIRDKKKKSAVIVAKAAAMLLLLLVMGNMASAQTNMFLQQGNSLYEQQKYKEAAADYQKALAKDPNNTPGMFNFGNSLYQQKLYDSSRKVMEATAKASKDKTGKAAANYNIGNTYMSQQKWDDAVNAYKNTLRNNPQDADAKYNLSYAEEMLKKQQQKDKDKNKDKKQDQKKDQNKQDQKKDQDKKDQDKKQDKDQQNKDQKDDKDKQDQQPQGQPIKISQQKADQLLDALQQKEKELQDKLKKEKGTPVKMEKDW